MFQEREGRGGGGGTRRFSESLDGKKKRAGPNERYRGGDGGPQEKREKEEMIVRKREGERERDEKNGQGFL